MTIRIWIAFLPNALTKEEVSCTVLCYAVATFKRANRENSAIFLTQSKTQFLANDLGVNGSIQRWPFSQITADLIYEHLERSG